MDQLATLKELEEREAKKAAVDEGRDTANLESMEILNEETEIEDLTASDNDGDDDVQIQADASSLIAARYKVDGQPDYFNMVTERPEFLNQRHISRVANDWYLDRVKPIKFYGASLKALEAKYKDFPVESAYRLADHSFAPFAADHRPLHAMTEGGKGITQYTRPVIYLTTDMSTINNFNITFGCPSNCSFCKESILGRGYTQLSVDEATGLVRIETENGDFVAPSKTKVRFWDQILDQSVMGPLSVAVVNQFPIATSSLEALRSGELTRLVSD
jgi:hypothetical protein